jgi:heme-degrading monooxygenase HmoA
MAGAGIFFSVIPASAHAQLPKGRTVMAYVHITTSKGRGIEDFRAVSAKHSPPQDIDGLLAWAVGSDEDGLHVVSVWQSRAHQERWAAEQLFPVFQELGMTDVPAGSEFTEYETGELYIR